MISLISVWTALKVVLWLTWRDVRSLFNSFWSNLIDAIILPVGILFISEYVMPFVGVPAGFGSFVLASSAIGMCFNCTGTDAGDLVADLESSKSITYELSLPTTYQLVCIKTGLVYAIKSIILNIFIFPVGFLFLPSFRFAQFSLLKFVITYVSANIMFGFFALCVALWVKDSLGYGRFWIRWGWLLFTIGGFQFSWIIMYQAVPKVAVLNLFNPLVYAFEGMRAATLGQPGFIHFGICMAALWISIGVFVLGSLYLFKKRLDCI